MSSKRVVDGAAIVVTRDKTFTVPAGTAFAFNADELKDIEGAGFEHRAPVNEDNELASDAGPVTEKPSLIASTGTHCNCLNLPNNLRLGVFKYLSATSPSLEVNTLVTIGFLSL